MKQRLPIIAAIVGAAFFGAVTANLVAAQQVKPMSAAALDRQAIEAIVRETIRDNPQIVVDALNDYSENHVKNIARNYLPEFLSEESGYVAGKNVPAAKVAVIEFFDYHCGFCKRSADFVRDLTKSDADVKVAFREYPILREESEMASRYALAARAQGKYPELHFALLKADGVITEERLLDIAKKAGLDVKRLEADQRNPDLGAIIDQDRRAAQEMGVDGTPTFIVASLDGEFIEIIPGFRPDAVKEAIAKAKKKR